MEEIVPSPKLPISVARAGVALCLFAAAAACAALGRSGPSLVDHMDDHRSRAHEVQAAVVHGDLSAARDPALWIAEHAEHPDLPQGVLSPVADMRAFARGVTRSASLQEASRCASEMASGCGRCHTAADVDVRVQDGAMPPGGRTPAAHMLRHAWAADRMWDGLLTPSDALWESGATALSENPLFLADEESGAEAGVLAREIHLLGSEARRLQDPDRRAGIYGRLLGTCTRCHSLMGIADGNAAH
jgi:hypothetical protein